MISFSWPASTGVHSQGTQNANFAILTLKVPEKLQLYGLYVYYVVHICDFGMLRVKKI